MGLCLLIVDVELDGFYVGVVHVCGVCGYEKTVYLGGCAQIYRFWVSVENDGGGLIAAGRGSRDRRDNFRCRCGNSFRTAGRVSWVFFGVGVDGAGVVFCIVL